MAEKNKTTIVLCVSGSVAAIRIPDLVRDLKKNGTDVICVMSENAQKIIHPNTLQWASENRVITELTGELEHVKLCGVGGMADLVVICPATANTISKIAAGIDDTPLTTVVSTAIGAKKPVIVVPAMHLSMYHNPFVNRNIAILKENGIIFIEPRIEENKAKLPRTEDIVKFIMEFIGYKLVKWV